MARHTARFLKCIWPFYDIAKQKPQPWNSFPLSNTIKNSFFPRHLQCLQIIIKPSEPVARGCSAISQNSQENTHVKASSLIKLQASAWSFIKKRLWHGGFPVNFAKFLRTTFLQNSSGRLFLNRYYHVAEGLKYI